MNYLSLSEQKQNVANIIIAQIKSLPRQKDAAIALGCTPGYITTLLKDPAKVCSLDTMLNYCSKLGAEVNISVSIDFNNKS